MAVAAYWLGVFELGAVTATHSTPVSHTPKCVIQYNCWVAGKSLHTSQALHQAEGQGTSNTPFKEGNQHE